MVISEIFPNSEQTLKMSLAGHDAIILIPARYASSRFPGKPLACILGKSMIQRVYENCSASGTPTVVVTDDPRIEQAVHSFGGNVWMVEDEVPTGSDRIYLALQRFGAHLPVKLIINVQGDEPLLSGTAIEELISFHRQSSFDIVTMVKKRTDWQGFQDPNRVKAIFSPASHRCCYFSRAPIPVHRGRSFSHWYLHIGVYSYRVQALQQMMDGAKGYYEQCEQLEQLRALELGLTIGAWETEDQLVGVDTPEDISLVAQILKR